MTQSELVREVVRAANRLVRRDGYMIDDRASPNPSNKSSLRIEVGPIAIFLWRASPTWLSIQSRLGDIRVMFESESHDERFALKFREPLVGLDPRLTADVLQEWLTMLNYKLILVDLALA